MAISVTHNRDAAIQVMHDMCDVPWDVATFVIDHLGTDWFKAPIVDTRRIIRFRHIARTHAIEVSMPSSEAPNGTVIDMATGVMIMPEMRPARVLTEV